MPASSSSALGLLRKGWREAERLARKAEEEQLGRMSPAEGIEQLLVLRSWARSVEEPSQRGEATEVEEGHLRGLVGVASALRRLRAHR